jgi:hypothetical protein
MPVTEELVRIPSQFHNKMITQSVPCVDRATPRQVEFGSNQKHLDKQNNSGRSKTPG